MTQPLRIAFLDAATYGDVPLERFTTRWDCTIHQTTTADQTSRRLAAHSVVVTNKVVLDGALLASPDASDLRLIAVAATGTDIIDREAAAKSGVRVCNVPGYATHSVAQFTLALILELATRVGRYAAAVRAGEWQKSPVFALTSYHSTELSGKKLGIIGYGSIGRAVATMARGFGLQVAVATRPGAAGVAPDRISLDELFATSDFVTLHCPLTPQTRDLVNERTLGLMKRSAFLINTARGGLVHEQALLSALRQRRLAGAALDVISAEPPPADHPVICAATELDNLVVTPHTAWSAREARERLLEEVEANIAAFSEGRDRNRVA